MAAFKPYGKPPPFDLEEYKDSFELWEKQWEVFLALWTIDSTLAAADRPAYKRNILLSCLSKETLQTPSEHGPDNGRNGECGHDY